MKPSCRLSTFKDYTDRPWTNTAPDSSTFELLQEIYGIPSQTDNTGDGTVISSGSTSSQSYLRGDVPDEIPDSIKQRANEAASNLETKFADDESSEDWVQLHRDDNTAAFQIELGGGYYLQAHFLLVSPDDRM